MSIRVLGYSLTRTISLRNKILLSLRRHSLHGTAIVGPVVTSYNSYFANSFLLVRDFKAWRPDSTVDGKYPTVQYDKVMENDRSLCEWLEKIVSCPCNGLCFCGHLENLYLYSTSGDSVSLKEFLSTQNKQTN